MTTGQNTRYAPNSPTLEDDETLTAPSPTINRSSNPFIDHIQAPIAPDHLSMHNFVPSTPFLHTAAFRQRSPSDIPFLNNRLHNSFSGPFHTAYNVRSDPNPSHPFPPQQPVIPSLPSQPFLNTTTNAQHHPFPLQFHPNSNLPVAQNFPPFFPYAYNQAQAPFSHYIPSQHVYYQYPVPHSSNAPHISASHASVQQPSQFASFNPLQSHSVHSVNPHSSSTTSRSITSIFHIVHLEGSENFKFWDRSIRSFIDSLGYIGHIYDPTRDPYNPTIIPIYQPILSNPPTQDEIRTANTWRMNDSQVKHILLNKLSTEVSGTVAFVEDATAREIYNMLRDTYSKRSWVGGQRIWDELLDLQPEEDFKQYCRKWIAGYGRVTRSEFHVEPLQAVLSFLKKVPPVNSLFGLKTEIMRELRRQGRRVDSQFFFNTVNEFIDSADLFPVSLSRKIGRTNSTINSNKPQSSSAANIKGESNKKERAPPIDCKTCGKRHPGPPEACWKLTGGPKQNQDRTQVNLIQLSPQKCGTCFLDICIKTALLFGVQSYDAQ